jgi:hypothetical protein
MVFLLEVEVDARIASATIVDRWDICRVIVRGLVAREEEEVVEEELLVEEGDVWRVSLSYYSYLYESIVRRSWFWHLGQLRRWYVYLYFDDENLFVTPIRISLTYIIYGFLIIFCPFPGGGYGGGYGGGDGTGMGRPTTHHYVPAEVTEDVLFDERIAIGSLFNAFFDAPVDVKIAGRDVAAPEVIE